LVKEAQIVPRRPPSPLNGPSASISGTYRERRSFDFFRLRTAQELLLAIKAPEWSRLILQASHCDPAVRHAAVALGSLGERFLINNVLTQENDEANTRHVFGRLQYQNAMEKLRLQLSAGHQTSTELALICCFLFICFEFLQGNDTAALTHLRSGLNIVRVSYAKISSYAVPNAPASMEYEIARVFAVLDMHATLWLGTKAFQAEDLVPRNSGVFCATVPQCFGSTDEAGVSISTQVNEMLAFRRSIPPPAKLRLSGHMFTMATAQRDRLLIQLDNWHIAFMCLMAQLQDELGSQGLHRTSVMSIQYRMVFMLLSTCLEPDDKEIYNGFESYFEQIIAMATSQLRHTNAAVKSESISTYRGAWKMDEPMLLFDFRDGLIAPLYHTATHCCNRKMAHTAVLLLSSSPWREGAWDSAAMAKIAERKICQLEEGGWYNTS